MSQPPPDLFPEPPVRSDFARAEFHRLRFLRAPSYRTRRIITVSVIAIILVFVLRAVFGGPSTMSPGAIATIKAEGAWKQRPEQPGGLDIPNQNVQVYQALDNKDGVKPPAEHLMPPSEVPQPVSGVPAASPVPPSANAPSAVESLTPPKLEIDSIPTTVTPAAPSATPAAAPVTTPSVPVAPPTAVESSPPTPAPAAEPASAAAHPAPTPTVKSKPPLTIAQVLQDVKTTSKTDRVVQLASVPDEATARDMAEKMQTRYASILGSAHLHLVKADIPGKGVYYRIQSQPITGDHASGICAALKQMKAGCILVRP
jgi:hypothetical protein